MRRIVQAIVKSKLLAFLLCSTTLVAFANAGATDTLASVVTSVDTDQAKTQQVTESAVNPAAEAAPETAGQAANLPAEQFSKPSTDSGVSQQQVLQQARENPLQPKPFKAPSFGIGYYLQLFFGLLFVIALIYGCAWLMRRFNAATVPGAGAMRVLGSLAVGAKERVVLVQVGETQMLLGVAPGSVTTLQVFSQPVVGKTVGKAVGKTGGKEVEQENTNPFADKLKFALGQRGS